MNFKKAFGLDPTRGAVTRCRTPGVALQLSHPINFEILDKFNVYNSDTKLPAVAWAKIRTTNI